MTIRNLRTNKNKIYRNLKNNINRKKKKRDKETYSCIEINQKA